mmetsp:Transcript_3695/g.5371  ORF Transcript_3695/g.5371 Transcript_3695/m.5371 type:complete len:267 (-) Transcript_3695:53-853(-)
MMNKRAGSDQGDSKMQRFSGKNAIVTAGTLGIGLAIAERLLEEGARVFICSRRDKNVQEAVGLLKQKGGSIGGVVCNVGDPAQLEAFVHSALKFFGSNVIDVVVSNAAANPKMGMTVDMSEAVYDKIFSVNVKSYWNLTRLCRPYMKRGSSIIFISSVGGLQPRPPLGLYAVSKTAIISLGRVLAEELGPSGIRVNVVAPGIIRTRMSKFFWEDDEDQVKARDTCFLGRYGETTEIAGIVSFLCSDDAGFITGETIVASGGVHTRL